MKNWPPKDWRAIAALIFSAGGAGALTVFLWWLCAQLLQGEWTGATEADRVRALRWVAWGAMISIGAVLLSLGMAINRRSFKGNIGSAGFDFEGGDAATPAQAAKATADAAEQKAEEIAARDERRATPGVDDPDGDTR